MGLHADVDAATAVVALNATVEQVATGFIFAEGPIWMPDGSLHFSDMPGDKRRRWHPEDALTILKDPCNRSNGMTLDNDGNLIVCEHVTSRVVRETPDGATEVVASHYGGRELNSPNDVIVTSDGSIVFTDPDFGRTIPAVGLERPLELDFRGVFRVPPDGSELQLLASDFMTPNGLCASPDENRLYVNDSVAAHVRVFDVGPGFQLTGGEVFAEGIGDSADVAAGEPDGMKCDELGNVLVTGPGGVWIFNPEGERLGIIEVPENVNNMNWGGSDWKTLYLAATTSIYRVRMNVAGARLGYMW
jgi:gluconolactonase